jgi:hypothetical protein
MRSVSYNGVECVRVSQEIIVENNPVYQPYEITWDILIGQ